MSSQAIKLICSPKELKIQMQEYESNAYKTLESYVSRPTQLPVWYSVKLSACPNANVLITPLLRQSESTRHFKFTVVPKSLIITKKDWETPAYFSISIKNSKIESSFKVYSLSSQFF